MFSLSIRWDVQLILVIYKYFFKECGPCYHQSITFAPYSLNLFCTFNTSLCMSKLLESNFTIIFFECVAHRSSNSNIYQSILISFSKFLSKHTHFCGTQHSYHDFCNAECSVSYKLVGLVTISKTFQKAFHNFKLINFTSKSYIVKHISNSL